MALLLSNGMYYFSLSIYSNPLTRATIDRLYCLLQLLCMVVTICVLLLVQIVLMELIPDTPRCVKIQLERTEFIVSKLIDRIPDSESMIKTIKHNSSNNSSTNSSEKSTNNSLLNARDKNKKSKKLIQISQYPQEL